MSTPKFNNEVVEGAEIVSGLVEVAEGERWTTPVKPGLYIGVTFQAKVDCRRRSGHEPWRQINTGLTRFFVENEDVIEHHASSAHQAGGVFYHIPRSELARHGVDEKLARTFVGGHLQEPSTVVDHAMNSLARQIIACPLRGPGRSLFLWSRILAMTALAVECVEPNSTPKVSLAHGFKLEEIERLEAAKGIMGTEFQDPPTLRELAARVGLSLKKLKMGFPCVYGVTVFEHLAEVRMQCAFQLLSSGGLSVTQIAHEVGFSSSSSFSVAFSRRFGMPPGALRG